MRNLMCAICCFTLLAAAVARGGDQGATTTETVLIRSDFDAADALPPGPTPLGTLAGWEGDTVGEMGKIRVSDTATPTGKGKAVQITNVAHKAGRSPALLFAWDAPTEGTLAIDYKFMVPIDGQYLSICYLGGDWKTAAAILIAENGKLFVQYGERDARITLGAYQPNHWHAVRLDLDVAARSVDVSLDGQKKLNKLPWQPAAKSVGRMNLYADFTPVDRNGAPVLYVDDVSIVKTGLAAPPSTQPAPRAAAAPKATERSFRYGVCAHLRRHKGADYDKLIDAIDRLGVDMVRDGVDWNAIEPAEGVWAFDRMDQIVNDLHTRGVEVQPLLAYSAKWASTGPTNTRDWHDWNNRAPRIEPFKAYATAMVNRYKDRVHYWEIWNEPDIGFWLSSTAEYVELFNAASAAIVQADPTAKVLNGGFAMERRAPNMNFLTEFLRGANPTHWGIWAYHDYNTFGQMIAREKLNRQHYESKKLSIPIWINEGGFNMLTRGGEAEQAVSLAKKIAAAPSMGIEAYFWYDLIDDGVQPLDPEHHFGLLRADFTPKPAFLAYQQLIRDLAPRKFAHRLPASEELPGLWAFFYQSADVKDEHVLVLWREGKGRETPLWIGTKDGGTATAVDAMDGTRVSAPELDGGMLVTVSDSPVYVHLRGSLQPQVRPFLLLPDKLAVLPGQDNTLRIQIANPTTREATYAISIETDSPSVRVGASLPDVRLEPGKSSTFTTSATLTGGADAKSDGFLTVRVRPVGGGASVDAKVPYIVASALPKLANASPLPLLPGQGLQLKLDTSDAIVNLFSAEPNPVMHWHGPADLSATAQLAYSDDALYLQVVATDDTHVQPHRAAEIWRSDSIQLAIRTDDNRPEYLEAGLALGDDGKPQGWIYNLPAGSPLALGAVGNGVTYDVKRDDKQTRYSIRIPWASLGIQGVPTNGLRINFIVNDDDGQERKGWVQLSDGIGRDKNPNLFRLFVCK